MDNVVITAVQVGVLFALMGVGVASRWTGLVGDGAIKGLVNLLIIVVTPCLIIDVFQRPFDIAMFGSLGLGFVIAALGHLAIIAIAYLCVRRRSPAARPVLLTSAVFSNAGFMGIPLEQAILGDIGVFFGITYVVVFNFFMWSWGLSVMKGDGRFSRTIIVNPGTVGILIGMPMFLFSVNLPEIVSTPIHMMANLNTPLAMIVIGYYLAGAKFGRVFRDIHAYVAMFIRLVGYPLLMVVCLYPFRGCLDRTMMLTMVTAASAPVAAMVSMLASKYERDVDLSVGMVSGSTLLSIITIPCVVAFALEVL